MTTSPDPAKSPEPGCVCAECGHEQETMDPCAKCRSFRVVLVSIVRAMFGEDWRRNFEAETSTETP